MRLDMYLADRRSMTRSRAKALIERGSVSVDGKTVTKPAFDISEEASPSIEVDEDALPYVSRGGLKLRGALDEFKIDVAGRICADIGASTGGFTDCLIKSGAAKVYAVDSGSNQLAESLRRDARVVSMEHFNARELTRDSFGELCSLAVADLSFISQTLVLDAVASILEDGGEYIGLIKPQFECGRSALGKGGIVRDASEHLRAVDRVTLCATECGFTVKSVISSPIFGGDGNREFLFHAIKTGETAQCLLTHAELKRLVAK